MAKLIFTILNGSKWFSPERTRSMVHTSSVRVLLAETSRLCLSWSLLQLSWVVLAWKVIEQKQAEEQQAYMEAMELAKLQQQAKKEEKKKEPVKPKVEMKRRFLWLAKLRSLPHLSLRRMNS